MNKPHTHTPQLYIPSTKQLTSKTTGRGFPVAGACPGPGQTPPMGAQMKFIRSHLPPCLISPILLFSWRGTVTEMVEANQERIKESIDKDTSLEKSAPLNWTALGGQGSSRIFCL